MAGSDAAQRSEFFATMLARGELSQGSSGSGNDVTCFPRQRVGLRLAALYVCELCAHTWKVVKRGGTWRTRTLLGVRRVPLWPDER